MTNHRPYFVGRLNWAPQDPAHPRQWRLEDPFGLVYGHFLIIIPPWCPTDGASIPWFLQWVLDEPFENDNKFWAVFHDGGYRRYAIVIDLRKLLMQPADIFNMYTADAASCYGIVRDALVPCTELERKWWDKMACTGAMVAAGTPKWKRSVIYRGLRAGGWYAWYKGGKRAGAC